MELDPFILSRIQFAFVVSFHIIFPSFTIGLASWLAMLEWRWLRTRNPAYKRLYFFWSKIFAVAFGMGVVSGVVMSYQFGTNWSRFSDATGNILGPLLAYEVLTAFFLEASFLGIMLFGWNKVGPRLHFLSTLAVAFGTLVSSFWILSANSWMQTPTGFELRDDGIFYPTDWWEIVFNPSFPYRLVHMVLAAYLTTALVIAAVASYYRLNKRFAEESRIMLAMAMWFIAIVAPTQLVAGDAHGLNAFEHQPAKVAAMEGRWDTMDGAPLILFAIPDSQDETNHMEIGIPKGASLILTHDPDGTVHGLKDFAVEDRPPVGIVFWGFRVMVGLGMAMIFLGFYGSWLLWRGRLDSTKWFQKFCLFMGPSGFVAVLSGWFVAEVGRQPWVVYGVMRSADAVSPVPGGSVALSLVLFVLTYGVIFTAGIIYILRLFRKGPEHPHTPDIDSGHTPSRPLSVPDNATDMGEKA